MFDKHIYFSLEETLKIKEYARNKKLTFTGATRELIKIALENEEVLNQLNILEKHIVDILKKQRINLLLLEQLYSDLDFENITDTKSSKALQKFKNKLQRKNIND